MRRSHLIILLLIICNPYTLPAVDKDYIVHMRNAKSMTDTGSVEKTFILAANYFERIANVNPGEWLPHYYAAYCYARISHLNNNGNIKDMWVDKAQFEIDKAFNMKPGNSEIIVMKGFVLQARMNISPMIRGFKYNDETLGYFKKAIEINPENPRAYLFYGVNLLHTPSIFGGGKENAYPLIKKSVDKFKAFIPSDSIAPDWGYSYALEMLENCK